MLAKKGGIGFTITMTYSIIVAIGVLALISPITSAMFLQASTNANLTGIEKVIVEHINLVLILVLTLILFLLAFGGGD